VARKFISKEFLGSEEMSYIKIQEGDEAVINPENNTIVGTIKNNRIRHKHASEESFNIKETLLGAKYIGPFPTEYVQGIINDINGYCSKKN
jgi:hypothetical protein